MVKELSKYKLSEWGYSNEDGTLAALTQKT
jgi:hypothetical protein